MSERKEQPDGGNGAVTVDSFVEKYITGGKEAVSAAKKENGKEVTDSLTLTDLKMDSLDVVQLAVKIQDDLGIKLDDDEFAKIPQGKNEQGEIIYKPIDQVTLGDIKNVINSKRGSK